MHRDIIAVLKERTIPNALSFLRVRQTEYGELLTERSANADLIGAAPDSCTFTTANAVCCLEHVVTFEVEDIRSGCINFLLSQMEDGGVWRYWSTHNSRHAQIPFDADDTGCAAFAL